MAPAGGLLCLFDMSLILWALPYPLTQYMCPFPALGLNTAISPKHRSPSLWRTIFSIQYSKSRCASCYWGVPAPRSSPWTELHTRVHTHLHTHLCQYLSPFSSIVLCYIKDHEFVMSGWLGQLSICLWLSLWSQGSRVESRIWLPT